MLHFQCRLITVKVKEEVIQMKKRAIVLLVVFAPAAKPQKKVIV